MQVELEKIEELSRIIKEIQEVNLNLETWIDNLSDEERSFAEGFGPIPLDAVLQTLESIENDLEEETTIIWDHRAEPPWDEINSYLEEFGCKIRAKDSRSCSSCVVIDKIQ